MLYIAFQDFGKTVKEDEVKYLMNKFYRGGNAGKKPGAGLGLYLCKCLLLRMEGELELSQNEKGFCVCVGLLLT